MDVSVSAGLRARPAELRDAPAITHIYNQGIEDRVGTFETEPARWTRSRPGSSMPRRS